MVKVCRVDNAAAFLLPCNVIGTSQRIYNDNTVMISKPCIRVIKDHLAEDATGGGPPAPAARPATPQNTSG
jgi:hypothetical protein